MTGLMLLDALSDALEKEMQELKLKTKGGALRSPVVFREHLPLPKGQKPKPRGSDDAPDSPDSTPDQYGPEDFEANFPCVVVHVDDWIDEPEQATVNVRVLIGAYDENPDAQGYRDVMNVAEHIRQFLMINPVLQRRYRLKLPLQGELFDGQPWPVFFGQLRTSWTAKRPAGLPNRKDGDYNNGTYPDNPKPE